MTCNGTCSSLSALRRTPTCRDDARVRRALDRVPCASRLTNLLSASVEKAGPQSLVTVGGARVSALDGLKGAPMRIALRCRFGSEPGSGAGCSTARPQRKRPIGRARGNNHRYRERSELLPGISLISQAVKTFGLLAYAFSWGRRYSLGKECLRRA